MSKHKFSGKAKGAFVVVMGDDGGAVDDGKDVDVTVTVRDRDGLRWVRDGKESVLAKDTSGVRGECREDSFGWNWNACKPGDGAAIADGQCESKAAAKLLVRAVVEAYDKMLAGAK